MLHCIIEDNGNGFAAPGNRYRETILSTIITQERLNGLGKVNPPPGQPPYSGQEMKRTGIRCYWIFLFAGKEVNFRLPWKRAVGKVRALLCLRSQDKVGRICIAIKENIYLS